MLFPGSYLSNFLPIPFKLCLDIDGREEWFRIANGLNLFINNRVMALDRCNARYFGLIFNRVIALDRSQNFVYAQYLVN